jgi:Zn-dependent protease with chaperone function
MTSRLPTQQRERRHGHCDATGKGNYSGTSVSRLRHAKGIGTYAIDAIASQVYTAVRLRLSLRFPADADDFTAAYTNNENVGRPCDVTARAITAVPQLHVAITQGISAHTH